MTLLVKRLLISISKVVIKITNDITTLNGSLMELGEKLATNLTNKGVTANASDGLTTLVGKINNIPTGSGGVTNVVQGSFTTGSTRNTTQTVTISYTGTGYPIAVMIFIKGGAYNNSSTGNTTWYSSVNRYDVGNYSMSKARGTTTPTWSTSGADNYGVVDIIYKNSTSTSTTYTRTSTMTANVFTSSSTSAQSSTACVRFKGNNKTMSVYIGNKASGSIGFASETEYTYIVIYSS